MASNWDEEFDFEDVADKKNKKKEARGSKRNQFDNQFVDLDDGDKGVKLPSLNSRTVERSNQKPKRSYEDLLLQDIKPAAKKVVEPEVKEDYQFEEQAIEEPVQYNTQPLRNYPREVQPVKNSNNSKLEQEEEYGEENFQAQENYDQEFQANEPEQEKKESPVIYKTKQVKGKSTKPIVNIPKPANRDSRRGVGSVAKKMDNSARVVSRTSARSYQKSSHSRTKIQEKKEEAGKDIPNKYTLFTQKLCPQFDNKALEEFGLDKLTRQNERVRNTIKKLNDELNDLINKNIMQLKNKKTEKEVNQQDIVKTLEEQKISNETNIQNSNRQLVKLREKEGSLRSQDYHLTLDQNIRQAKGHLTQYGKNITKLNFDIDNEGKKLTKIDKADKEHPTVQIGSVKLNLISSQKDFDKHEEQMKKQQLKFEQLTKKINDLDNKINSQIDQAKRKGFSLITNPQLHKKVEELKKKIDNTRQHKNKTQNLYKTKAEMGSHENDQIRTQIKQIQNSTLNCHTGCEDMQSESKKTVERARRGGKVPPEFILNLESILNQMERGQLTSKESEDRSSLAQMKANRKYYSQKHVDKVIPATKQTQKSQDDSNIKKPILFKKKKQQIQRVIKVEGEDKQQERVWKDQNKKSPRIPEKTRESAGELAKFEQKQEKRQQSKKPFTIKRNKDKTTTSEDYKQSPKQEIKPKQVIPQQKNQQNPTIAPRMFKFKKNRDESQKQETKPIEINDKNSVPQVKQVPKEEIKEEQEKPVFVPKRFNMRMKDKKSDDAGYIASSVVEKKQQPKIEEQKPIGLSLNIQGSVPKDVQKLVEQQEKPKFNIKLKNRQKQNKQQPVKIQNESIKEQIEQPQAKVMISLSDEPQPSKQNNNPYANPYAQAYEGKKKEKKEKQGPIKEQKVVNNAPKAKYDLFSQAQDLTNVNQIKAESPKPAPSSYSQPQNEQLDLNQLLGKPKNGGSKPAAYDDLLLDNSLFDKK